MHIFLHSPVGYGHDVYNICPIILFLVMQWAFLQEARKVESIEVRAYLDQISPIFVVIGCGGVTSWLV